MKRVPGIKVTPYVHYSILFLFILLPYLNIVLSSVGPLPLIEEADIRHHMKIQDHPQSFYETFDIVIAGLDSIPARRWMNATMVQIAQEGNIIPLIDGGTEGMLHRPLCRCSS
jgi:hypothetical protein